MYLYLKHETTKQMCNSIKHNVFPGSQSTVSLFLLLPSIKAVLKINIFNIKLVISFKWSANMCITYHPRRRNSHIWLPLSCQASLSAKTQIDTPLFSVYIHIYIYIWYQFRANRAQKALLTHLLLLFLQFFVLHLLELGPDGQHFLLELRGAQLIDVQHQRELDILQHTSPQNKTFRSKCDVNDLLLREKVGCWRPTLRTFALTDSFSL